MAKKSSVTTISFDIPDGMYKSSEILSAFLESQGWEGVLVGSITRKGFNSEQPVSVKASNIVYNSAEELMAKHDAAILHIHEQTKQQDAAKT